MDFANHYSALDRLVHNIAFSSRSAQIALSGVEDKLFSRQLNRIQADRPVFVSALPRAGTTLLLEMLESSGEFGVHIYRDMPLLLTPLLWSKLSGSFRQSDEPRERAHGDGMMVSVESPEAFEETLWAEFWPDQYKEAWVEPWHPRFKHEQFEDFFRQHFKKILLLRQTVDKRPERYLSKNNMNIGRLEYILKAFPDAQIVVPFRTPLQHAASLLKQHLGFLKLHEEDEFARRYMREIGHYDFGHNLKPINFNGWVQRYPELKPTHLDFWLRYWVEAYQAIFERSNPAIRLFDFDVFTHQPEASLGRLANWLGMKDIDGLVGQSARVAPPKSHEHERLANEKLMLEANTLFDRLKSAAEH